MTPYSSGKPLLQRLSPLVALVLMTGQNTGAADHSTSDTTGMTLQMDKVVVTGTRTDKMMIDSPVKVEVISREEIEKKHAHTLKQALEDLPGLMLRKIHGKPGYAAWLQGVSANRVLVLIDGEPVAKSTGSTTDLSQIGTANIDHIEVVKGATSALYGSAAIGGVINVITRTEQPPFSYHFSADAGTFGDQNPENTQVSDINAAGRLSGQLGNWHSQLNFNLSDSEGWQTKRGSWPQEGPDGRKMDADLDSTYNLTPYLSGGLITRARLMAGIAWFDDDSESRFTVNAGGKDINYFKREEISRVRLSLGSALRFEDESDLRIRYYHEDFDDQTWQDAAATPWQDQTRVAELASQRISVQYNRFYSDNHIFTFGSEWYEESLEQNQTKIDASGQTKRVAEVQPGSDRSNTVFFFQDDYFATESLELLPGFRYQHDSGFGSYLAPKLNARYELITDSLAQQHLRFGIGRGYRVPDLKERYYVFDHSHLGYMVLGNPDLEPESSNSFQLGWALAMPDRYQLDINLFYNSLKNLIETTVDEQASQQQGLMINRYSNINRATTRGVEFSAVSLVKQAPIINGDIKYTFGYTYLRAKDEETGNTLAKRPKHQIKAGIDLSSADGSITLGIAGEWQSGSYYDQNNTLTSPAYSVFDIKANYRLTDDIVLYAGIDNLTGTQKLVGRQHDLRPEEGRYIYAGIRIAGAETR
ncbi:MAG: ferric-rhodotorulic acid transporter [Proteobacteria bacterium]|nr:MAG: ferric-rhodotorulic acid transporter [Pseudomonadota bacterium]